jgi:hypothetical protein
MTHDLELHFKKGAKIHKIKRHREFKRLEEFNVPLQKN